MSFTLKKLEEINNKSSSLSLFFNTQKKQDQYSKKQIHQFLLQKVQQYIETYGDYMFDQLLMKGSISKSIQSQIWENYKFTIDKEIRKLILENIQTWKIKDFTANKATYTQLEGLSIYKKSQKPYIKNKSPFYKIIHINFPNLQSLNLRSCGLYSIQSLGLLNCPNLKVIGLKNNHITSLKPFYKFNAKSLFHIDLNLNHFNPNQLNYLRKVNLTNNDSFQIDNKQISFGSFFSDDDQDNIRHEYLPPDWVQSFRSTKFQTGVFTQKKNVKFYSKMFCNYILKLKQSNQTVEPLMYLGYGTNYKYGQVTGSISQNLREKQDNYFRQQNFLKKFEQKKDKIQKIIQKNKQQGIYENLLQKQKNQNQFRNKKKKNKKSIIKSYLQQER